MHKVEFTEKIKSIVGNDNVLYTLTESGLIYSWGNSDYKRITRSCDTSLPSRENITEKVDRKSVHVKFDGFILNNAPTARDECQRTWTLKNGVWRKTKVVVAGVTPTQVQFIGFK